MCAKSDEEIFYAALVRYRTCCKGKKTKNLNQLQLSSEKENIMHTVDKHLLFWGSKSTTIAEKEKLCGRGKAVYKKYCLQIKKTPELITERIDHKLDEMLHYIAVFEADRMWMLRRKKFAGEKIDLEKIFEEEKNIQLYFNHSLGKFLEELLYKKSYTVVGQDIVSVYMTATGAKYHRANCPYCKGKKLLPTTKSMVKNIGLLPCKCMANKSLQENEGKTTVQTEKYVTAFVDESIRLNPWHVHNASLPAKQAAIGYIICDGMLPSESHIRENNIMQIGVEPATNIRSTSALAIEAILKVLFKLATNGYKENVIIYTDNTGARTSWYKSKASKNLAKLFNSVIVCCIPRAKNTKADNLVRSRVIVDLPAEFAMQLSVAKCLD